MAVNSWLAASTSRALKFLTWFTHADTSSVIWPHHRALFFFSAVRSSTGITFIAGHSRAVSAVFVAFFGHWLRTVWTQLPNCHSQASTHAFHSCNLESGNVYLSQKTHTGRRTGGELGGALCTCSCCVCQLSGSVLWRQRKTHLKNFSIYSCAWVYVQIPVVMYK